MVGDMTFTLGATPRTTKVTQFDGRRVERSLDISDDDILQNVISHELTSNGITRSMVKLNRDFVNATTSVNESASVHIVLGYASGEGKAKAKELADALADWLLENSNENLDSVGQKQYGVPDA